MLMGRRTRSVTIGQNSTVIYTHQFTLFRGRENISTGKNVKGVDGSSGEWEAEVYVLIEDISNNDLKESNIVIVRSVP